jgi:hypothetical protein
LEWICCDQKSAWTIWCEQGVECVPPSRSEVLALIHDDRVIANGRHIPLVDEVLCRNGVPPFRPSILGDDESRWRENRTSKAMETEDVGSRVLESILEVLRQRKVVTHEERALTAFGTSTRPPLGEIGLARTSGTSREYALVVGEADERAKPSGRGFVDTV